MAIWNAAITAVASVVVVLAAAAPTVFGSSEAEALKRFAPMEAHLDHVEIEVTAGSSVAVCAQTYPLAPSGFRFVARYGHTQLLDKTGYDRMSPRRCAMYAAPDSNRPFVDRVDIVLRGEVLDSVRVVVYAATT